MQVNHVILNVATQPWSRHILATLRINPSNLMNQARRISDAFNHNQEIICCVIKKIKCFQLPPSQWLLYTPPWWRYKQRSRDTQSHMIHSFIALVTMCSTSRDANKHSLRCWMFSILNSSALECTSWKLACAV